MEGPVNPASSAAGSTGGRANDRLDCAFLASVVLVAALLYLPRIGFYSDDWAFLGVLHTAGSTFADRFSALSPVMPMRPVQTLLVSGIYHWFGAAPLPFHLVNTLILIAGCLGFYLVLRELGLPRAVRLAAPLLYAVLPHYSADRFWIAAMQATASMLLYFISLYADLRAVRSPVTRLRWWTLAATARVLCLLAYEVFLPLLLLNPLLVWLHWRRRPGGDRPSPVGSLAGLYAIALGTLAPIVVFKVMVTNRLGGSNGWFEQLGWFWTATKGAAGVATRDFGVLLPRAVWRLWQGAPSVAAAALAAATGILSYLYLSRVSKRAVGPPARMKTSLLLVVAGLAAFPAGYGIYYFTRGGTDPTGIANRVAIASTVGVALVWTGIATGLSVWRHAPAMRARLFGFLIAVPFAASVFINGTLATFWIEAYGQARGVLATIRRAYPAYPGPGTLLLDGVCPYIGPGIVFEANWDLAGALELEYGKVGLRADVVTPNLAVSDSAIVTWLYSPADTTSYPYDRITIFNGRTGISYPIPDATAARRYFETYNPDRGGGCPPGKAGHGVRVF